MRPLAISQARALLQAPDACGLVALHHPVSSIQAHPDPSGDASCCAEEKAADLKLLEAPPDAGGKSKTLVPRALDADDEEEDEGEEASSDDEEVIQISRQMHLQCNGLGVLPYESIRKGNPGFQDQIEHPG